MGRSLPEGIRAVSVDLFDTLLLRTTTPEPERFHQIARLQHQALRDAGVPTPRIEDLFQGRRLAMEVAYRSAKPNQGSREGRLVDILALLCHTVGLDPVHVPLLRRVELDYEAAHLTLNRALAAALQRCREHGLRVLFLSDMYLSAEDIAELLARCAPGLVLDGGHVSSTTGLTKHGRGGLFRHALACEGLTPDQLFHVGDNRHSDVAMAHQVGVRARHLPRGLVWRLVAWGRRRCCGRTKGFASGPHWGRKTPNPVLLAAALWDYCYRLHLFQKAYQREGARVLYVARGGLRLERLYRAFLERCGEAAPLPGQAFLISRVAVCKGCFVTDRDLVTTLLCREFARWPLERMVSALLPRNSQGERRHFAAADWPPNLAQRSVTPETFQTLMSSDTPPGQALNRHFTEQAALFEAYVRSVLGEARTLLLVDTGWSGTAQRLLSRRFPDHTWRGLYVGRWNTHNDPAPHFHDMVGISLDHARLAPRALPAALFEYHHLIEAPLEAAMPSIEAYRRLPDGTVCADPPVTPATLARATLASATTPQPNGARPNDPRPNDDAAEALYAGILAFFAQGPVGRTVAEITRDRTAALNALGRRIRSPRRADLATLTVPPRSADFGKDQAVPVVRPAEPGVPLGQRLWRARRALWVQGQLRTDFPLLGGVLCACYNFLAHFPALSSIASRRLARHLATRRPPPPPPGP